MSIRQGRPEDYSKGPYLIVLDVAPCSLTFALQSPPPGASLPYRCSSFALRSVTATFLDHRHSWTSLVPITKTKHRNIITSPGLIPLCALNSVALVTTYLLCLRILCTYIVLRYLRILYLRITIYSFQSYSNESQRNHCSV